MINPGTHILTATAKGFSRVSKRVYLPYNMNKAGRVDFVLAKVGSLSLLSCSTNGLKRKGRSTAELLFEMVICYLFSSSSPFPYVQAPVEPDIDDHLFPTLDTWDRFDPYNQFERYSEPDVGEGGIERQEKPWWWNYFSQSGITPPHWLLRNI